MNNTQYKAMSWALKNGIKIYAVATKKGLGIVIEDNGKKVRSPDLYKNNKEASKKIWELYTYLYNKHK
jgi:predicted aldo/keto reductase-like oxidoreductase